MVVFIKKYGFLFVHAIYWLVYMVSRFTCNGVVESYTQCFFDSIRHDGVFIKYSLLVFYLIFLLFDVANKEISGVILVCAIMLFNVVSLIV